MDATGLDRAAQRRPGREQAALADHLVDVARAHALGERAQVFPDGIGIDQVRGGNRGNVATCHDGGIIRLGEPETR